MYQTRPRSNSMNEVHEHTGGVRSQARLEINGTAFHTDVFNTDSLKKEHGQAAHDRDRFGSHSTMGLSHNDAEVPMLAQAHKRFKQPLKALQDEPGVQHSVHIEYHGNHGPCLDCQKRFERSNEALASQLPVGTELTSSVHYEAAPATGKRGGTTTYGFVGDTQNEIYGEKGTRLHRHELSPMQGTWKKREKVESQASSSGSGRGGQASRNHNTFGLLANLVEDEGFAPPIESPRKKSDATSKPGEKRVEKQSVTNPNTSQSDSSGSRNKSKSNSKTAKRGNNTGSSNASAPKPGATWAAWGAGLGASVGATVGGLFGHTMNTHSDHTQPGPMGELSPLTTTAAHAGLGAMVGGTVGWAVGKAVDYFKPQSTSPGPRASSASNTKSKPTKSSRKK